LRSEKKLKVITELPKTLLRNLFLIFSASLVILSSCENNPGDVGLSFISPNDTTGVKYLDSETDSMEISSSSYRIPVNTYASSTMLIGKYEQYESKTILKFRDIPGDYDSSVVVSATLVLKNNNYYYVNKTGTTAFNVFKVNQNLNLTKITIDSITSSTIGTTPLGFYSGAVPDSQTISVAIDNQTVKNWLEAAADTSYPEKNYGVMLQPTSASNTIKGFYSYANAAELVPYLSVVKTKNGVTDTVKLSLSESVSLSDAPASVIPQDRMLVQNGIAYRSSLTFDLSKLPSNVIINNATLKFTLDSKLSYLSESGVKTMIVGLVNDTANYGDTLFVNAFLRDSITYSVSLNQIFQTWNSGNLPNLGVSLRGFYELQNLDKFVMYSPAVSDTTKRPRLKIYYTLRN
jgi:hypothetical protein